MIWFNNEIVFDKYTLKFGYSCMRSIRSKLDGHNKNIPQPKPTELQKDGTAIVKMKLPNKWIMFIIM